MTRPWLSRRSLDDHGHFEWCALHCPAGWQDCVDEFEISEYKDLANAKRCAVMKKSQTRTLPAGKADMVDLAGGEFTMGSSAFYPEEAPPRRVRVDPFAIDRGPVTNADFAHFVRATGYRTLAELPPDRALYPDMLPEMEVAGSMVFVQPRYQVAISDINAWWHWVPGADWRHPQGPESSIKGFENHPVVHVAYADAQAYATWAGKLLPSEAEWEFAARGGLDDMAYAWGSDLRINQIVPANIWQGIFPHIDAKPPGRTRTSAVGVYPPNGYGLLDMIGNTWEWTADWFASTEAVAKACCVAQNPRGGTEAESRDPSLPSTPLGRRVLKGGSHLCAENYCRRYRPAARLAQMIDTSTSHIGFRCIAHP